MFSYGKYSLRNLSSTMLSILVLFKGLSNCKSWTLKLGLTIHM